MWSFTRWQAHSCIQNYLCVHLHHNQRCMYGSNTSRSCWFYFLLWSLYCSGVKVSKNPQHRLTERVLYSGSGREKWCLIRLWQKLHLEILQGEREQVDRIKLSKVYWLLCFAQQYIGSKSTMFKQDILSLSFTPPISWAELRKLNLQSLTTCVFRFRRI